VKAVIGLDTSCYTTSVAAVDELGRVIASLRKLLPVPMGQRGLRQSDAVFEHVRQLPGLLTELGRAAADYEIAAVCASVKPRDGEDSYMPVFLAGDAQGRGLAALLHIPCFAATHQAGHVKAAMLDSGLEVSEFLAVHLSGGTTEVLQSRGTSIECIGGTLDLNAGQLVDRVGVMLHLPFPCGPYLEELAVKGQSQSLLPVNMADEDLHCHLSGAETKVTNWLKSGEKSPEDAAAEVYDFLARTVSRLISGAGKKTGLRSALVAGGVSSSPLFRELLLKRMRKLDEGLKLYFGHPAYSGDNAVGVALLGLDQLLETGKHGSSKLP
jgi:N6-L-threonylcarbamoyladenine synthase